MARAKKAVGSPGDHYVSFRCPGCDDHHVIPITGVHAWGFNGDYDRPTLTPSILCKYTPWNDVTEQYDGPASICHSFVREGRIEFLSDCSHALAGQTVDMLEVTTEST